MSFAAEFRGVLTGLALFAVAVLIAIDGPILVPGQELLQSLRFHIALAIVGLVILLVISGGLWRGLALLALVLFSAGIGGWYIYQQQAARAPLVNRPVLARVNLLSFNVLADNPRGGDIADYMIQTSPDLVVVMESNAILPELDRLAQVFPHRAGCNANGSDCDLMLLSRTPLRNVQVIPLRPFERLRLVTAVTTIGGQDVTIVGTHLSKPYFDEASWVELEQIGELINQIEGPLILAGDFNATAWSESIVRFVRETRLVPPPFYPATWPVRFGAAGVPIDNMFSRDALIRSSQSLDNALGSNHRGVTAQIDLLRP